MTKRFNVLLAFVLGVAFGVWTVRAIEPEPAVGRPAEQPAVMWMAACPEDSLLKGVGEYRHGRWTRYVCAEGGE